MSGDRQKRGERLQLMLTLEEIEKVDSWRFERRMPSRSAAVRALMKLGFRADGASGGPHPHGAQGVSSAEVGVLTTDRRIEAGEDGDPVVVVATELMSGHAVKSILTDAGKTTIGPLTEVSDIEREAGQGREVTAVVIVAASTVKLRELADAARSFEAPTLVCTKDGAVDGIPKMLHSVPIVSFLSAPEALGATLDHVVDEESLPGA